MDTTSEYNKIYYLAHPELKEKAKERERQKRAEAKVAEKSRQVPKVKSKTLFHDSKISLFIELILLPCLLVFTTLLLLREMTTFYSATDASQFFVWVKAIGLEASVLIFSFLGHPSAFRTGLYKTVAILICAFSIYAMSSKCFSDGVTSARSDLITERAVTDLEAVIKRKEIQSDELRGKGWITAYRKMERSIDALRVELSQLRIKLTEAHPSTATLSTTAGQVLFRLLIMVVNMLAASHLKFSLKAFESFKTHLESSSRSLEISKRRLKLSRREDQPQKPRGGGVPENVFDWLWKWIPIGERIQS